MFPCMVEGSFLLREVASGSSVQCYGLGVFYPLFDVGKALSRFC